jgi:hypothetical protein
VLWTRQHQGSTLVANTYYELPDAANPGSIALGIYTRDGVRRGCDGITTVSWMSRLKSISMLSILSLSITLRREKGEQLPLFGKETLMVNASIMSVTYKPWGAPWLVDLDLELAK